MRRRGDLWSLVVGLALLAACTRDTGYCEGDADCPAGLRCSSDTHLCYPLLGYGTLTSGPYAQALTCPQARSPEIYNGVDLERRTCAGCACMSARCSGQARGFAAAACGGAETGGIALAEGCTTLSGQQSYRVDSTTVSCAVNAAGARPAPSIVDHARLCVAADGAACTTLECVLEAGAQADPSAPWCVLLDGEAVCPPAFPVSQRWFRAYQDTRTCACRCQPNNSQCALTGYTSTMCGGSPLPVKTAMCLSVNPLSLSLGAGAGAGCTASGEVSSTGTFTLSGPVTACCNR